MAEGGGDHHAHLPPDVIAYHDALAPAWHSEPGETRRAAGCEAAPTLVERATTITNGSAPENAEAGAWQEAAQALLARSNDLVTACDADAANPTAADAAFPPVHQAFHNLIEPLHGEGPEEQDSWSDGEGGEGEQGAADE